MNLRMHLQLGGLAVLYPAGPADDQPHDCGLADPDSGDHAGYVFTANELLRLLETVTDSDTAVETVRAIELAEQTP